jgi:DNA-binding CsgD family transcriptional regulator
VSERQAGFVGRGLELAAVESFVTESDRASAMVLEGFAGIGKTAIWAQSLESAEEFGFIVRSGRCSVADSAWAYSGLSDLLEDLPADAMMELPEVQRRALSIALLHEDSSIGSPGDRVVAVAVLGILRLLCRSAPLIVAIDDLQWLDAPSRSVLTFALRRMINDPIRVLGTERLESDSPEAQERLCLGLAATRRLIGPVSIGTLQQILVGQLSISLSRPTLARLHQATGGNPMVSLEMGRVLHSRGESDLRDSLPVTSEVERLVADRLGGLSVEARDLLMVCGSLAHPTIDTVGAALAKPSTLETSVAEVLRSGTMELRLGRFRFTHPLLASIPYELLRVEERRVLHARLAAAVDDLEEHARHAALATDGPDNDVAEALDVAARRARQRGNTVTAAELAAMAASRTPLDRRDELHCRRLTEAELEFAIGDTDRARSIVSGILTGLVFPADRIRAMLLLATIEYWTAGSPAAASWCEAALGEAGEDRLLCARCHAAIADLAPYDAHVLLDHARLAVELIADETSLPDVLANALKNVAYHELRLGQGLSVDVLQRAIDVEQNSEPLPVIERVGMYMGMLLRFAGRFDEARHWLEEMRQCAQDEGDDNALPLIYGHLGLLDCWVGNFPLALQHVADGLQHTALTGVHSPSVTAAHSLAEAHLGHLDKARQIALAALDHDELHGDASDVACDLRSLGFAELCAGELTGAASHLLRALSIADELGIGEPAILRIHGDAVEALVGIGRLAEAEHLTAELERSFHSTSGWASVISARCRGLVAATNGDLISAETAFVASLSVADVGMPIEEARTRLWLGTVLRRSGRRTDARIELNAALEVFQRLGTPLLAARATNELTRIGGRAAGTLALTPTEQRVAELVGSGHTSAEVAEALFISVRTVESHLTRIYRKLGVRSRAQLARVHFTSP